MLCPPFVCQVQNCQWLFLTTVDIDTDYTYGVWNKWSSTHMNLKDNCESVVANQKPFFKLMASFNVVKL